MEEIYEAEAIRSKKIINNKMYYEIKWKDYPETENTLEPCENLKGVQHMIAEFEKKNSMKKSMNKKDDNFIHSKSANSKEFPNELFDEKKNGFDFFEEKTTLKGNELSAILEKKINLAFDKMENEKTIPKSLFNNISNDIGEIKKNMTEMKTLFERKKKKENFLDKVLKGPEEIFKDQINLEKSKAAEKMLLENNIPIHSQEEEEKKEILPLTIKTILKSNQIIEKQNNSFEIEKKMNEKEELFQTFTPLLQIYQKENIFEKEKSKSKDFLVEKTSVLKINEILFPESQDEYQKEDLQCNKFLEENNDLSKINSKPKANFLSSMKEKDFSPSQDVEKKSQNIEIEEEIKIKISENRTLNETLLNDNNQMKNHFLDLTQNQEMDQELNEIIDERIKKLKLDDSNFKKISIKNEREQQKKRMEKGERQTIEQYKDDLYMMPALLLKKKFNLTKLHFGNFKFDKIDQIKGIFCEKNDNNKEEPANKKIYAKISWKPRRNGDQMANSIVEYMMLKQEYPEVLAEYFFNKLKNKIKEEIL